MPRCVDGKMKITLKYEEAATEEHHMTLRLTLPQKYVNGTNKEVAQLGLLRGSLLPPQVVKLFVNHYNKSGPLEESWRNRETKEA